jgi:phosphoglycolate phosphatase-like HAD superfamily hydrolase
VKLVLFDVDGTRLDNLRGDDAAYLRAFQREFGIDKIDADWSKYAHCTDSCITREILSAHFGRPATDDDVRRAREAYVEELRRAFASGTGCATPMRGVEAALDAVAALGFVTALATGGWRASALLKLEAAGLAAMTRRPGGFADDHETREGIAEIARARAEHEARRVAERVVFVGDAVWDVKACAALRLPFVGIAKGPRAERLSAAGASIVLPDFTDGFVEALDVALPP